jgi:hypothetical protein
MRLPRGQPARGAHGGLGRAPCPPAVLTLPFFFTFPPPLLISSRSNFGSLFTNVPVYVHDRRAPPELQGSAASGGQHAGRLGEARRMKLLHTKTIIFVPAALHYSVCSRYLRSRTANGTALKDTAMVFGNAGFRS